MTLIIYSPGRLDQESQWNFNLMITDGVSDGDGQCESQISTVEYNDYVRF